jgi:hypothetical protein
MRSVRIFTLSGNQEPSKENWEIKDLRVSRCVYVKWSLFHQINIPSIYTVWGSVVTWDRLVMSSSRIACCLSADRQESSFPSLCHEWATLPRTCNSFSPGDDCPFRLTGRGCIRPEVAAPAWLEVFSYAHEIPGFAWSWPTLPHVDSGRQVCRLARSTSFTSFTSFTSSLRSLHSTNSENTHFDNNTQQNMLPILQDSVNHRPRDNLAAVIHSPDRHVSLSSEVGFAQRKRPLLSAECCFRLELGLF